MGKGGGRMKEDNGKKRIRVHFSNARGALLDLSIGI